MTHLDHVIFAIQRLDFGEGPACADNLRCQLCDRGAKFIFISRGDAARCQQGRSEVHARAESFVLFLVHTALVVSERGEVEVFHHAVEAHAGSRVPGEVVGVDGGIEGEDLFSEAHAGLGLRHGYLLDPLTQLIELDHFDVGADRGRQ